MLLRERSQRWRALAAGVVVVMAFALPASSRAAPGVTPFVDCIASPNGASGVWFGFSNTSSAAVDVPVGPNNFVTPGISFQGQPVHFGVGTYRHAFFVPFGQLAEIIWTLNTLEADATGSSPDCIDAVTAPASMLTPTAATLNGVVTPYGDTSYVFQWGTKASYGQLSKPATVTGNAPGLVTDQLTGLKPGTTYHYRLQASNVDDGVTDGADQTFTTPLAAAQPVDLSLTKIKSPATVVTGKTYTYVLRATNNSATTAASGVTVRDALPGAFSLVNATSSQGSCSGSTTVVCALGALAPRETATVAIAGMAGGKSPLVNTASVAVEQPDPDTANNVVSAVTNVLVAPDVLTGPGIGVTPSGGLVLGTVNPEGHQTSYQFDYGASTAYAHRTRAKNAGARASSRFVTALLSGLHARRTYHYRLVASNAAGTTDGADHTLRTLNRESHGRGHSADLPTISVLAASDGCPGHVAIAVLGGSMRHVSVYLDGTLILRSTRHVLGVRLSGGRQLTVVVLDGSGHKQQRRITLAPCA
jgi:uncharacterized repeat protein (TIGR01451 family)